MEIDALRKKHPKLTYKSYDVNLKGIDLTITSHFVLHPDIEFHPQVTIHGVSKTDFSTLSQEEINTYAFHLGMAEIFSYWKAAASPLIEVEAGFLSPEQLAFWHDLLIQGMGEYFYVNQIDFTQPDFVTITSTSREESPLSAPYNIVDRPNNSLSGVLVSLGGGKDSLVSLELLKEQYPEEITLFALNPIKAVRDTVAHNSKLNYITATRVIDPTLLELNKKGYLNGHTPFSSYLAFLTSFVARIFGLKYIAISNERSSNEASVIYKDHPINHQYSKSYQLEENFQNYFKNLHLSPSPFYFSLLRPLYELQIAKIFSSYSEYFPIFKSCNKGQKSDSWCCNCSKCLFAFIILYPFLDEKEITTIFGVNLLNNESLWNTTKELLGYAHQKPLDCVGTHEESIVALYLCYQKEKKDIKVLSNITEKFRKEILPKEKNVDTRAQHILKAWNTTHSLPPEFDRIVEYVYHRTFETQ